MCEKCVKKQMKLDKTMGRLKLVMKELNDSISKLKKEEKTEAKEVS